MSVDASRPDALNDVEPSVSLSGAVSMLAAAAAGALAAVLIVPSWLPGLAGSLLGPEAHAYWYLSRASAVVAYLLLWFSVALGLGVTNKMARVWPGGPTAVDLHQFASLLGFAFALFHALVLLGDRYIDYAIWNIAIPFGSLQYRPLPVGLGQVAFFLLVPVTLSFYARRWMGFRLWRTLHYGSFVVYLFITLHGLLAGTDTTTPWMLGLYIAAGVSVYLLLLYRILTAPKAKGQAQVRR